MEIYRFLYTMILIAAAAFSQAYAGHLSSVILITLLILPLFSYAFTFAVKSAFFFEYSIDEEVIEKNKPLKMSFLIKNRSLFPCSSAYIQASMPGFSEKKDAGLIFSLSPFQTKRLNLTFTPEYRGEYDISFDTVYFYDFFKLFKLEKTLDMHEKITVTPRIIDINAEGEIITPSNSESEKQALNSANGEKSFTRKYAEGDDVRNIHWKLSAKQDDYMVWQNTESFSMQTVTLCDLTLCGTTEKEQAANTDAVIESALAAALYNIKNDCGSLISFYNPDSGQITNVNAECLSHLYDVAYAAASLKGYAGNPDFYSVCKHYFISNTKSSAILITPHGDRRLAELAEELSAFSEVRILLIGKSEAPVKKYLDALRNVAVAEINPFDTDSDIGRAISAVCKSNYGQI